MGNIARGGGGGGETGSAVVNPASFCYLWGEKPSAGLFVVRLAVSPYWLIVVRTRLGVTKKQTLFFQRALCSGGEKVGG